ncbi:leucine-rich repeat domain-containing protein [Roseomonas stagni]|uniref:Leucine-rich repeat domain-containing protein n=1 Tax=Falsiroseomonas algicola TaxID=2716930 RepID=A0A6M1LH74_9PROT|nr:leucine-rich repeat domain-containing protein [Falsiroseomonas algicola]NGM19472.1 leucine-rich repeat domain-containing protein [Falsiroseomonas algicola]
MAERAFHELLAGHLDAGTRPGLKPGAVGAKWTAVSFGKAVSFEDRTIRNWRNASTLPDSEALAFILAALFGDDAALRADRAALQEAWDAAQRRRLERTPQQASGLRFRVEGEQFVSDATPDPNDAAAARDAAVRQQFEIVRQSVAKLRGLVERRHNSLTPYWDDLLPSVTAIERRLSGPIEALLPNMSWFYNEAIAIGSLLEQQASLLARAEEGENPLPGDLHRVLGDMVGALALLVRGFPSNRERDAQFAMFWDRDAVTAARAVKAMAAGLLAAPEAALLDAVERTAERPSVQGDKAKGSLIASIGNLALAATVSLMLSGVANESPFIKKVSQFVVRIEEPIGRVLGSLPQDIGAAIRFAMDMAKGLPDALPPRRIERVSPSTSAGEVQEDPHTEDQAPSPDALYPPRYNFWKLLEYIEAGATPPAYMAQHVVELNLHGRRVPDASVLLHLPNLRRLGFRKSGAPDLSQFNLAHSLREVAIARTDFTYAAEPRFPASLKKLNISGSNFRSLDFLTELIALEELSLGEVEVQSHFTWNSAPLRHLAGLTHLAVYNNENFGVDSLKDLTRLHTLKLEQTGIHDLTELATLRTVRHLSIAGNAAHDFMPLSNMTELRSLKLSNTPVTDLRALSKLQKLETLNLCNTNVRDLRPIAQLPNLKSIYFLESDAIDEAMVSAFTAMAPQVRIVRNAHAYHADTLSVAAIAFQPYEELPP